MISRNDDADRIGGHGEHHEHEERQRFNGGQVLARHSPTSIASAAGNVESMFSPRSGMRDCRRHCFQIDAQPRPFGVVPPFHPDAVIFRGQEMEIARECRVRVAEADQLE